MNNLNDLGLLNMDSVSDVLLNLLMMSDADIKLVTGIRLDKYPKMIEIEDSLEAMQKIVGGDIEEYMPFI